MIDFSKILFLDIETVSQCLNKSVLRKLLLVALCFFPFFAYTQNVNDTTSSISIEDDEEIIIAFPDSTDYKTIVYAAEKMFSKHQWNFSIISFKKAAKCAPTELDKAYCLKRIGKAYFNQEENQKAAEHYEKALAIYRDCNNSDMLAYQEDLAETLLGLANCHCHQRIYNKAQNEYEEALKLYKEFSTFKPTAYNEQLGCIYMELGKIHAFTHKDFEKGLTYLNESIEIIKEMDDMDKSISNQTNLYNANLEIALIYEFLADDEAAKKKFIESNNALIPLREKDPSNPKYNEIYAFNLSHIGFANQGLGNTEDASRFFAESLKIYKELEKNNQIKNLQNFSWLYYINGVNNYYRKEYKEAEYYLKGYLNDYPYYEYSSYEIQYFLGFCCLFQGKNEEATTYWLLNYEQDSTDIHVIQNLAWTFPLFNDFKNAYFFTKKMIENERISYQKGDEMAKKTLPSDLGDLSYYANAIGLFSESEKYAEEALQFDSSLIWIKTNTVSSLLFQGKYEDARKVAFEIKDLVQEDGTTYKQSLLEDWNLFEELDIIPEQFKSDLEHLKSEL